MMPLSNPYIVGNPIENRNLFFGREDDFTYIHNKITGSGSGGILVLCGSRRSGKTSILFQIKNGRLGEDYIPVMLDMQSLTVGRDAEFLARLTQEIVDSVADPALTADIKAMRAATDEVAYSTFQDFLAQLPALLGGRQLVLLFDEYEIIESCIRAGKLTQGILRTLANWLEHTQGVFIIFTGSDKLELRDPRYWQSFLGKALHRRISFLSRNDTLRLVREPVLEIIDYDEGAPDLIYQLTNGQPFYTQVICQSLVDLLNEEGRRAISVADVDHVVQEIIENPLPHMIFAWSSLDAMERMILSCLASMAPAAGAVVDVADLEDYPRREDLGFTFDPHRLREATERLFGEDLLIKDTGGSCYGFKMDLWRRWVRRMHSTWQVLDEIDKGNNQGDGGILPSRKSGAAKLRVGVLAGVALAVGLLAFFVWWGNRDGSDAGPRLASVGQENIAAADSGWVKISTTPSGAVVAANGRVLGIADGQRLRLPSGETRFELSLDQHVSWATTRSIGKDSLTVLQVELVRETGALRVFSEPAGAAIYLDGVDTNQRTPAVITGLPVRQGYRVELRSAGLVTWSSPAFAVTADDTHVITRQLSGLSYGLSIFTRPAAAEIFVDGRSVGQAPVHLADLPAGPQQIEARLAGYSNASVSLSIPALNNMATLQLQPVSPGILVIKVINTYAEIWVDGERLAEQATNHQVSLRPGWHAIELRHPAYESYLTEVEITSGETSVCEHTFRKGGDGQ